MLTDIFLKHKKICIALGTILAAILLILYVYALLLPGVWHRDAFLYRQDDGSFMGSDFYAEYQMHIAPTEGRTDISFAVNGTVNQYQIIYSPATPGVQIFENGALVFQGNVHSIGDSYLLVDADGGIADNIQVIAGNTVPTEEELFPNYNQLYNWAISEKYDIRGNLAMLILICIAAVILVLDIVFPDLFFALQYRLAVDGGEPSDWYRMGQIIGRVLLGIAIIACIVLSFTVH